MKNRVFRMIAILAMTITMSGLVYVENSWAQGPAAGAASGGGGDGGGGGSSSGGEGVTTSGGIAPTAVAGGVPGDARLTGDLESGMLFASTSPIPFSRTQSPIGLTRAQEHTWDAFGQCATRGATIDQLRIDGSFTFQSTTQNDARTIKDCMTRLGYRFDY